MEELVRTGAKGRKLPHHTEPPQFTNNAEAGAESCCLLGHSGAFLSRPVPKLGLLSLLQASHSEASPEAASWWAQLANVNRPQSPSRHLPQTQGLLPFKIHVTNLP